LQNCKIVMILYVSVTNLEGASSLLFEHHNVKELGGAYNNLNLCPQNIQIKMSKISVLVPQIAQ
jgi:hypothetical protein